MSPVEFPKKSDPEVLRWIKSFQSGDTSAITPIVKAIQAPLFRFCYYLTGNMQSAQELTQDVFVKLLSELERTSHFENERRFHSWLHTIARNLFLSAKRTSTGKIESHTREQLKKEKQDFLERLPDVEAEDVETLIVLKSLLQKLPEKDRLIVLLIDYQGYSYEEAAEILGMNEAAMNSRLYKARKRFFELYHGHATT